MKNFILIVAVLSVWPLTALALDSFSYSGRLVNNNGSPVAGPVDLRFDLSSTVPLTGTLCTKTVSGVQLSQGVFHVKLKFDPTDCGGDAFQDVMESIPSNQNMTYQVTDVTNSRTYAVQNMYAVPSSFMANFAKNLPQMGALPNQVLKWDDGLKRWVPGSAGSGDGTVKTISTDASLTGGPITDTGTLAVAVGGITNAHLAGGIDPAKLAGTRDATNYLKGDNTWGTFASDVLNTVLTGFSTASTAVVTATDSVLTAIGKLQGQASDLSTNKLDKTGGTLSVGTINGVPTPVFPDQIVNKQYVDDQLGGVNSSQWLDAAPHIYFNTGNVGVGTATPNEKLDVVGNVALTGRLRLQDSGSNFVELRAPLTTAGVTFTLPATAGTTGQVLKTDGTGILSWGNSSVGSADITDGSIVDADVAAGAAIAQSKIANLTTDLAGKEPTITAGTAAQYWRGDKTWQTLNTDVVPEGATNKYFTNTLARGAISAASPISYNSGTGVIGMVPGTTGDLLQFNGTSWVPWTPNFLTSEADTLATVTGRGATTATAVTLSGGANFPGSGVWTAAGNVGIGTGTPRSRLDVVGAVQIGADASTCDITKVGAIRYNAGNVEYCNGGPIWQAFGVSGSGITNFNGSTVGAHSLATPGTTGLAPNWVTVPATGVHTLNIPMANAAGVTAGLISKADYDDFKNVADGFNVGSLVGNRIMVSTPTSIVEAPALTNGQLLIGSTGNTPVAATLTAGTGVTISNSPGGITINATGSGGTVTSVSGTAPISVATGTTTPVISISQSNATTDGYLSSTDWNTFNNKQAPLSAGATINGIVYPANGTQTLQIPLSPVNLTDAVNKQYVDSFGQWGTNAGNVYRTSGNVGIGTSTPSSALEVAGQVKITGGTPGAGKVLTSDADGLATWQTPGSGADNLGDHTANMNIELDTNWVSGDGDSEGIFIDFLGKVGVGTSAPTFNLTVGDGTAVDGSIMAKGYGINSGLTLTEAGAGVRMFWYPKKAAFRAGEVYDVKWNDANIGKHSAAFGEDTTASGDYSFAAGTLNTVTGDGSVAFGWNNTASGVDSMAVGEGSVASGMASIALGTAVTASAMRSVAIGESATASGNRSTAMGYRTTSDSFYQFTVGKDNLPLGTENATTWVTTDPLFVVGNGTGTGASRSNALMILKNGNIGMGTSTPGAKLEVAGQVKITGGSPGAGKVLTSDAAGLASWTTIAPGGVTSVSGTAPVTVTGTTTPVVSMSQANTTTNGYLSSTDWNTFNSKLGTSTAFSGDVTGTYNATSVDRIKGTPVTITTLTSGNFLRFNGTAWVNAMLGASDIPNLDAAKITTGVLPVARGGTNNGTLSGNRIMVSTATSIVEAPALTNGQLLIGSTGATPVAATLTAGTGVSITNSAGGITINATGSGGTISALTGDVTASGTGSVAATIANDAVTSAKILDGTIVNADIANSTITYGKLNLADGSIPVAKLVRMTCLPGEVITSDVALGYRCVADSATDTTKLPLAGGTMTGAITLAGNPTANLHAATKEYVDTAVSGVASVWSTNGTNIYKNNSGNVGIGITAPLVPLHMQSTSTTTVTQMGITAPNLTAGNGTLFGIGKNWSPGEAFSIGYYHETASNDRYMGIQWFGASPTLAYTQGGNLGIGTITPGAKLEVAGQVKITGGSPGAGKVLTSDASGLATWQTSLGTGDFKSDGTVAMTGAFRAADGSAASPSISFSSSPTTGFYNLAGNILFSHNGTARFGIDNSSMYGIGGSVWRFSYTNTAAAPAITLDGTTTGFYRPAASTIGFSTAGTERMRIDATGNVGIGTTAPGAKLEVAGQVKITGGTPGAGKVLTSDASGLATWQTAGGGTPAGSNRQVQFNNAGAFGASSNFTYDGTTLNATTNLDSWGLATIQGENTQVTNNSEVYGVKGVISNPFSTDSAGVYGVTLGSGHGVLGRSGPGINSGGVMGINSSTSNGWGVYGIADAATGSNSGVAGYAVSTDGYGGRFFNLNGWALFSEGNFGISSGSFLNWGTTRGATGYGIRDNAGIIECKNNGGAWAPCAGGSGISGSGTTNNIPKFTAAGAIGNSVILEDASNRIGIGGTPTNYRLEVFNNLNNTHGIWVKNSSNGTSAGSQIALSIGATNSVGGNLAINSSAVNADLANRLSLFTQPTTVTGISIAARNAGQDVRFYTGGTFEKMRLDATGNLLIGTTAANSILTVAGVITPSVDNTHTLGNATYRWSAVHATNGTIQTSDKRLKKEISDIPLGEDFINSLNPVQYRWKNKGSDQKLHFGFLAQDVDQKLKEQKIGNNGIVNFDRDVDRFGINYSELIAPIVKSIQELFKRLKLEETNTQKIVNEQIELRKEIERLKAENAEMKVMVKELLRRPSGVKKDKSPK